MDFLSPIGWQALQKFSLIKGPYRIYWFSFPIPRVGIAGPAVELSFSFDLPSSKLHSEPVTRDSSCQILRNGLNCKYNPRLSQLRQLQLVLNCLESQRHHQRELLRYYFLSELSIQVLKLPTGEAETLPSSGQVKQLLAFPVRCDTTVLGLMQKTMYGKSERYAESKSKKGS